MTLEIQHDRTPQGHTVCRPIGSLDAFTVGQLRHSLAQLTTADSLIIDLSYTAVIDSAGLVTLIGGIRAAKEMHRNIAVACSRPAMIRSLRNSGLDRIVTLTRSVAEAAARLPTPSSQ